MLIEQCEKKVYQRATSMNIFILKHTSEGFLYMIYTTENKNQHSKNHVKNEDKI